MLAPCAEAWWKTSLLFFIVSINFRGQWLHFDTWRMALVRPKNIRGDRIQCPGRQDRKSESMWAWCGRQNIVQGLEYSSESCSHKVNMNFVWGGGGFFSIGITKLLVTWLKTLKNSVTLKWKMCLFCWNFESLTSLQQTARWDTTFRYLGAFLAFARSSHHVWKQKTTPKTTTNRLFHENISELLLKVGFVQLQPFCLLPPLLYKQEMSLLDSHSGNGQTRWLQIKISFYSKASRPANCWTKLSTGHCEQLLFLRNTAFTEACLIIFYFPNIKLHGPP